MSKFLNNLHPLLKRQRKTTGDDSNYAILNAINTVLNETESDSIASKTESYLKSATTEYLEQWGSWFGVFRKTPMETDDAFRNRIINRILIERGTIKGIQDAIKSAFPTYDVTIYETWKNIFYLNKSLMNGPDCIQGNYYRYAVIKVSVKGTITEDLKQLVKASAPVGVTIIYEQVS